MTRLYHLVAVNNKTDAVTALTTFPVTHSQACTMKSKFSHHPARRLELREASPMLMHPTDHERAEWARMARALPLGPARNRYATAAQPDASPNLRLIDFDELQTGYRAWLVFGEIPQA